MPRLSMGLGGEFDVWVECEGQRLPEFGSKYDTEQGRETCFVPSVVDKEFSVHWRHEAVPLFEVHVAVWLDGVSAAAKIATVDGPPNGSINAAFTSATTERRFTFGQLLLTDDDSAISDPSSLAEMGTIRVTFNIVARAGMSQIAPRVKSLPGDQPVHERSKKAGAHTVRYGTDQQTTPAMLTEVVPMPHIHPPREAVFSYAPEDYLRAREIITVNPTRAVVRVEPEAQRRPVKSEPASPPRTNGVKREAAEVIVISSDEDEDVDELTVEEKAIYQRLQQKLHRPRKKRRTPGEFELD